MEKLKWRGGGSLPLGYEFDSANKKLVINPEEEKIVKEIYELALEKHSATEIARRLYGKHVTRSGKPFSYTGIGYLLMQHRILFYAGMGENKEPGDWPKIITKQVAEKLLKTAAKKPRGKRPRKNTFLLTSLDLAFCGHCSGRIKSGSTKIREKNTHHYICTERHIHGVVKCPDSKQFKQEFINQPVIDNLILQYSRQKKLKTIQTTVLKNILDAANKNIKKIDQKIEKFLNLQNDSQSIKQNYNINQKLTELLTEREGYIKDPKNIFEMKLLDNAQIESLANLPIDEQRSLLKQFVKKIEIFNDRIRITYSFPLEVSGRDFTEIEV